MLSLFGFGKKRRSASKKSSKKTSRKVAKPPSKLLKICKKLKVKTTTKRGGKKMYKSARVLSKLCLKKLKMIKKRKLKMLKKMRKGKKSSKRTIKVKKSMKRSRVGDMMEFGARRRFQFGASCGGQPMGMPMQFGARRIAFGGHGMKGSEFGKRMRSMPKKKVSKAAAMKAFKSFYRRHCSASMGGRQSRFGNGGNPPLYQSMGDQFCPLGRGGVLGSTSTGLFSSPCTSMDRNAFASESAVRLGQRYSGQDQAAASKRQARDMKKSEITQRAAFGKLMRRRRAAPKQKVVRRVSKRS